MTGLPGLLPLVMKTISIFVPESGQRRADIDTTGIGTRAHRVSGRFFLRQRERRTKPVTYDRDVAARVWQVREAISAAVAPAEGRLRTV